MTIAKNIRNLVFTFGFVTAAFAMQSQTAQAGGQLIGGADNINSTLKLGTCHILVHHLEGSQPFTHQNVGQVQCLRQFPVRYGYLFPEALGVDGEWIPNN